MSNKRKPKSYSKYLWARPRREALKNGLLLFEGYMTDVSITLWWYSCEKEKENSVEGKGSEIEQ